MCMQKNALVLGGGFASNAYHAGVISVLQEKEITINKVAASSMASIAGTLFAAGKSADEILEFVLSIKRKDFFCVSEFLRSGFHISTGSKFVSKFESNIEISSFQDLQIPLQVCDNIKLYS